MTRIAFIGNSPLTAFKDAQAAIEGRFPDLSLSYFGLPNEVFFQSEHLKGTALNLKMPVSEMPDQVIDPDGEHALDLDAFDLVLLTSHSFYMMHVLTGLAGINVLGLRPANERFPLVSLPCVTDMITDIVQSYALRLRQFFPRHAHLMTIQTAYPSIEAVDHSPVLAELQRQPDLAHLFQLFNNAVQAQCHAEGVSLFPAPPNHLHSPFFSKPEYARQRSKAADVPTTLADYTHMNADYAATLFAQIHAELLA